MTMYAMSVTQRLPRRDATSLARHGNDEVGVVLPGYISFLLLKLTNIFIVVVTQSRN